VEGRSGDLVVVVHYRRGLTLPWSNDRRRRSRAAVNVEFSSGLAEVEDTRLESKQKRLVAAFHGQRFDGHIAPPISAVASEWVVWTLATAHSQ